MTELATRAASRSAAGGGTGARRRTPAAAGLSRPARVPLHASRDVRPYDLRVVDCARPQGQDDIWGAGFVWGPAARPVARAPAVRGGA